jgi:hypothetical protein
MERLSVPLDEPLLAEVMLSQPTLLTTDHLHPPPVMMLELAVPPD